MSVRCVLQQKRLNREHLPGTCLSVQQRRRKDETLSPKPSRRARVALPPTPKAKRAGTDRVHLLSQKTGARRSPAGTVYWACILKTWEMPH